MSGHSLEREARGYIRERRRRPQASRYEPTWTEYLKDAGEILLGVVVIGILMFVLPLVLWMAVQ